MSTQIGIGFSQKIDTEAAAVAAASQSKSYISNEKIDIALIFSTIHYDPRLAIPAIQTVLYETKMIGCSTAGIILSSSMETRGIAVLTISSDEILFGIGSVGNLDKKNIQRYGYLLEKDALAKFGGHSRQGFLFFVDGYLENNSPLLKGIQEIFGNVFPILGAGSCDDFHYSDNFQIFQDQVLTNAATGMIIGGHANIGIGCHHGWRPLGKPRIIDKAEGNIINTISGKKAASLYQEYFDKEPKSLQSDRFDQISILYPLGIFVKGSHEYLLRNAVQIREDGSIVCQGDVPMGAEVHIMIGNKESCKQAAIRAAEDAKKNLLGKQPKLIMIFESMARLKLLGRVAFEEIENITEIFGKKVPLIGMYANGEFSPFQTIEKFKIPYLLNESIVIVAIS